MKMWYICGLLFFCQVLTGNGKLTPLLERKEGEANIQQITWNCISKQSATNTWKTIASKGYPKRLFVKESRCSWKITAPKGQKVRLAFRGLDLHADNPAHCSANYLEIIDESLQKAQARFCGKNVPGDIVSKGARIRIDFQAQPGLSKNKGFQISFKATKDKPGFYSKKSFDPSKPPPTQRSKPQIFRAPPNIDDKDDSSSVDIGGIIGGIIAVLVVLGALIFYLRYREKIKKEKKMRKLSENSSPTRTTNTDMGLPQNEVDPFERMSAVCQISSKPHPLPGIELDAASSTYTNCKPPPLPKSPHPTLNRNRNGFHASNNKPFDAQSRHSFRSISTVATLPNKGVSTTGNLPRFNRKQSQQWIPIRPSTMSTTTSVVSQMNPRESRTLSRLSHRDTGRCHSRPWKPGNEPSGNKIYFPEKPLPPPPLPPKGQLMPNNNEDDTHTRNDSYRNSNTSKNLHMRSRSIGHLDDIDRGPHRSGRLRSSMRSNFSDVRHSNAEKYGAEVSKRDCLPRLQSTRSRAFNTQRQSNGLRSTTSVGPRSYQGKSATLF